MKTIIFVTILLTILLTIFSYSDDSKANTNVNAEKLVENLKGVPDNSIAYCITKTNDFAFVCALNKRNLYSCKIGIFTKYQIPNCKPVQCTKCDCEKEDPVIKNVTKPKQVNSILDLLTR